MLKYILPLIILLPLPTFAQSVIINEIAWMGTATSGNDEWIELYNTTSEEVDITEWQLKATDGSPTITLEGTIAGQSFFILERTDDQTLPNVNASQIYSGSLSNSGETLQLINADGAVIDQINADDGWPGGDNTTKQTLERDQETWHTSIDNGGTPNQTNSSGKTEKNGEEDDSETDNSKETKNNETSHATQYEAATKNDITINEVLTNPIINSDTIEFIEIKNMTQERLTLTDYYITTSRDQRYTLPETTIRPTGLLILERSLTNLALDNQSEKISLYSPQDKLIDTLTIKNSIAGKSYQQDAEGKYHWEHPSPRQENIITQLELPVIDIDVPTTAALGELLHVSATDSFDPNNHELSFEWQFGDGRKSNDPSPWQVYLSEGEFEITLTASNTKHSSTTSRSITIKDPTPKVTKQETTTSTATSTNNTAPHILGAQYEPTNIIISEFLPNPKGSDSDDEFIELFNNSNQVIDIAQWQLDDIPNGSKAYTFPTPTILQPFSYTAFFREQTNVALNNSSDEIILITPDGTVIDSASYSSSKEDMSYIRDEQGGWQQSSTPTPNELNSANQPEAEKNEVAPTNTINTPSIQSPEPLTTKENKKIPYKTILILGALSTLAIIGNMQQKKKFTKPKK